MERRCNRKQRIGEVCKFAMAEQHNPSLLYFPG
jgi:hypothetical protein